MTLSLNDLAGAGTEPDFAHRYRAFLNRIRLLALRCRAAAYIDLFSTSALLSMDMDADTQSFAEALLRTLPQGLGRAPVFYKPGTAEMSADEVWLMRLVERMDHGDWDSARFLVARRIAPPARRPFGFLVGNLALDMDTL